MKKLLFFVVMAGIFAATNCSLTDRLEEMENCASSENCPVTDCAGDCSMSFEGCKSSCTGSCTH